LNLEQKVIELEKRVAELERKATAATAARMDKKSNESKSINSIDLVLVSMNREEAIQFLKDKLHKAHLANHEILLDNYQLRQQLLKMVKSQPLNQEHRTDSELQVLLEKSYEENRRLRHMLFANDQIRSS
jgi:hypothetical protein